LVGNVGGVVWVVGVSECGFGGGFVVCVWWCGGWGLCVLFFTWWLFMNLTSSCYRLDSM